MRAFLAEIAGQGGEPEPPITRVVKSQLSGGGPVTAGARQHRDLCTMRTEIDDPAAEDVNALLEEHLRNMHELSPPGSVHALDANRLKGRDITFWTAREGGVLLGCGALKELDSQHGEIKSMRTTQAMRRKGVGGAILSHILTEARARGYKRLSLETGSMPAFLPAQRLYERFGFRNCAPFADYRPDPNSVFMTTEL